MGPPPGHMFCIDLYREKRQKIFLSETKRPRALIFGMKHHLVDIYQVCSDYAPWGQKWACPGGHMLDLYRDYMKKSFCLKPRGLEP